MTDAPTLTLTCLNTEECTVFFEPWGSEHVLKRGDLFLVSSAAIAKGAVEVSFTPNGLSICLSSNDEVVVTDKAGSRLTI